MLACLLAVLAAPCAHAYIYFGTGADETQAKIARADLDGAEVNSHFLASVPWTHAIAVDAGHLYWATGNYERGGGGLGRASLNGAAPSSSFVHGLPADAATSNYGSRSVAVDGSHVYFQDADGVGRANLDGSGVNFDFITRRAWAAGSRQGPDQIAVGGGYVYWYAGGQIGRANIDGTAVDESFIPGAGSPSYGLAVDARHIYWTLASGTIARANLDGTGVERSFIAGVNGAFGVAVDGWHIYWTRFPSVRTPGSVGRAKLDGSHVDASLIPHVFATEIAVDGLGPRGARCLHRPCSRRRGGHR